MSWRTVSASVVGTSHIDNGSGCQDSCIAFVESVATKPSLLSIFVADGAGSAACGGEGAELAIEAAAGFTSNAYINADHELDEGFAVGCIDAVRRRIFAAADKAGRPARDYACTFLALLTTANFTMAMQIGDGGIVLDTGEGLHVPIVPMSGEYANMTNFVTDENALDVIITKVYRQAASRVAVFSDGIQRLAMNMATNTPHEPFFLPFFQTLAITSSEKDDQLHDALVTFLGSAEVNDRTDDDKTLVIAIAGS